MSNVGVTDAPLLSMDEDLFSVKPYVTGLSSFINTCETPMTISIQGDWGSGKTSMMNMIKENMLDTVWPIWFNTWQFSQFRMGNGLAFSMIDVLIKGLGGKKNVLSTVAKGVLGFTRKVACVATDAVVGGEAAGMIRDVTTPTEDVDVAQEILRLKENFQKLVDEKLAKEKKNRVVIFVDDLDRLEPAKAVELLEILKLFLDCKNCVFILAVDYEVVTTGIREKYGDNVSAQKGRNFFDKIIQLPFKMPVAHYSVSKYVGDMMSKIGISVEGNDNELFTALIRTSIGFNPRAMKRLFNTYQLLDFVSRGTVMNIPNNIRQRILFTVVCLQTGFEELYTYLVSNNVDAQILQELSGTGDNDDIFDEILPKDTPVNMLQEKRASIQRFMPHFIKALQIDDDGTVSEEELRNLRVILKSSSITSTNSLETSAMEDEVWARRNYSKDIVESVCDKLQDIDDFRVKIPRKRDEKGMLPTFAYCCVDRQSANGVKYTLSFYVDWRPDNMIELGAELARADNHSVQEFRDMMGENPLNMKKKPAFWDWGGYWYKDLMCFNRNDYTIEQQIIDLIRNIVAGLK